MNRTKVVSELVKLAKELVAKGDDLLEAESLREWKKNEQDRREAISLNRSRRMRKLELVPVPPKMKKPQVWQLFDGEGGYIGTWPIGTTLEEAIEEAESAGENVKSWKMKDSLD
jgi:hypothetical protein